MAMTQTAEQRYTKPVLVAINKPFDEEDSLKALRSHALFSSFVQVAACKVSAAAAVCLRRRHVGGGALLLLCLTPRVCVRLSLCAVRCVGMAGKVHA